MKMAMPPSRHEPSGRNVVSTPARWILRVGVGLGIAYNTFSYIYRQLAGVVWDCPQCGATGAVVLRRRRSEYWFYCTGCRTRLYYFYTPDAEALAAELGAG